MILESSIQHKGLPKEAMEVALLIKRIVLFYDVSATVILFGSRARDDADNESDWDFLVLTETNDIDTLAKKLRKEIKEKIENIYFIAVSLIVKNKTVWESDYRVTNIYESIMEEGIGL